jgi:signal transduction histidine kinase
VTLTYDDEQLLLDVRDDGVGFDPATAPGPDSFGLRAMRQRAARLAGALEVESEPGLGATVTVRLPALREGAA